jgi:hypothetical protein
MLTWQSVDEPRLEGARVAFAQARRIRATGSMVTGPQAGTGAFVASYSLATTEDGKLDRLSVRVVSATGERQVQLHRSDDGVWLVDHGQGAERTSFDGAVDVDLYASPLFNTLPVRRLGLHLEQGKHELPVVFVTLPELTVSLVRQSYTSVSVTPEGATVTFASGEFSADLTVDGDGMVLDYPGLARLLRG